LTSTASEKTACSSSSLRVVTAEATSCGEGGAESEADFCWLLSSSGQLVWRVAHLHMQANHGAARQLGFRRWFEAVCANSRFPESRRHSPACASRQRSSETGWPAGAPRCKTELGRRRGSQVTHEQLDSSSSPADQGSMQHSRAGAARSCLNRLPSNRAPDEDQRAQRGNQARQAQHGDQAHRMRRSRRSVAIRRSSWSLVPVADTAIWAKMGRQASMSVQNVPRRM